MLFVVSLCGALHATDLPSKQPPILAHGWAAIPRDKWLSNYSHAYGAEKTIMAAGSTEDAMVAYNSAQPWSPAHGIVNGSFIRMTFGSQELRGKLLPSGYIIWENGSRWLKTLARLATPSASASKARLPSGVTKEGPADDESYSCVQSTALVGAKRPRTLTRTRFCRRRRGVVLIR